MDVLLKSGLVDEAPGRAKMAAFSRLNAEHLQHFLAEHRAVAAADLLDGVCAHRLHTEVVDGVVRHSRRVGLLHESHRANQARVTQLLEDQLRGERPGLLLHVGLDAPDEVRL